MYIVSVALLPLCHVTELQIRGLGVIRSRSFSDFSAGTCVVTSHWNRLDETVLVKTVLMMGHVTYLPIGRYVQLADSELCRITELLGYIGKVTEESIWPQGWYLYYDLSTGWSRPLLLVRQRHTNTTN